MKLRSSRSLVGYCMAARRGSSIFILFRLSDKRVRKVDALPANMRLPSRRLRTQILEWVDALLRPLCLFCLFSTLFFSSLCHSSESMVPEFMIGDRVVVLQNTFRPKFPLTDVGVPRMRTYKRGDIVVFNILIITIQGSRGDISWPPSCLYALLFQRLISTAMNFGEVKADSARKARNGGSRREADAVDGVLYSKTAKDSAFNAGTGRRDLGCLDILPPCRFLKNNRFNGFLLPRKHLILWFG